MYVTIVGPQCWSYILSVVRTQAANASKCRRRRRDKRLPPLVVRAPADIALHQSLISLPLDQPGLLLLEGGKVLQDGDVADSYYLR